MCMKQSTFDHQSVQGYYYLVCIKNYDVSFFSNADELPQQLESMYHSVWFFILFTRRNFVQL